MKKYKKIIFSVSLFCLMIALTVVGGFSLKHIVLSVDSDFSSINSSINATLSKGTMSGGTYITSSDSIKKTKSATITRTSSTINEIKTWKNIQVKYNSSNSDIVFSFSITNNATSTSNGFLQVDVTPVFNNASTSDIFVNRDSEVLFPNVSPYNTTTAGQKHIFNYTVTIRPSAKTPLYEINDISILFDFNVYYPTSYSSLVYNVSENSSNYTASVTGLKNSSTTSLTIYPVYKSSNSYFFEVTELDDLTDCNFANITLCNTLGAINNSAFNGCTFATDLIIPNSVFFIGDGAFEGANFQKNNVIMKTGEECRIGVSAFLDASIGRVELSKNTIDLKGDALAYINSSIVLPESLITLGNYVFEQSTVDTVVFGSKLTTIGSNLFADGSLNYAVFNDPIGWKAGTTPISSVDLSDPETAATYLTSTYASYVWTKSVPTESELSNLIFTTNSDGTASVKAANTSITSAEIPEYFIKSSDSKMYKVTSINVDGFNECSNLTSVTIPNSVTSIGAYTFNHCSKLTSVTIPNSVINIGTATFNGCSNLTSVTIPNSVTRIGDYAFWDCSSLTSITIPNSVISIGSYAFYYCSSLKSITIPNSVTSIGMSAFRDCSNLTSVTFNTTTGWKAGTTPLSSTNLSNTSTAATWLKTTYVSSTWTRT